MATIKLLLERFGYAKVEPDSFDPLSERIALYTVGAEPTHLARQLADGTWTSKLGPHADVEHDRADGARCEPYGDVSEYFERIERRPRAEEGLTDPVASDIMERTRIRRRLLAP